MALERGLGRGLGALLGDAALQSQEGGSLSLPISQVEPGLKQPRKRFDEESLQDLADSIRIHGIIQPLTVRRLSSGYYQIIAGERRWRAAKLAGLNEIPAVIIEADDRKVMELGLIENLQREDLNPIEEAAGFQSLMETYHMTQEEAASRVGKSRSAVANALRLLSLTPPVAKLVEEGKRVIADTGKAGGFAVVLAGRPYHTDPLINHDLSGMFTRRGIPVLTVDSLPGLEKADLRRSRVEITNDFHARMLSGAMVTAEQPCLEYVQIVSFGCGHDAILSDEIIRLLGEGSGKPPLILKVDESEAAGSLGIRVQSFIETVQLRRSAQAEQAACRLPEPYAVKYWREDKRLRTVLVPNISAPVSTLLTALMDREGIRAVSLPVGGVEQIRVGKKYTHNDICFPCQMVIGELIDALQKGNYPEDSVAVGMAKLSCDCRMANYTAILRKALDSAGFENVPILTTDPGDTKGIHPGVSMLGARSVLLAAWAFSMLDILEELCRKIRPYELEPGSADRAFGEGMDFLTEGIRKGGVSGAKKGFKKAIERMKQVAYDRSRPRPTAPL